MVSQSARPLGPAVAWNRMTPRGGLVSAAVLCSTWHLEHMHTFNCLLVVFRKTILLGNLNYSLKRSPPTIITGPILHILQFPKNTIKRNVN